MASVGELSTDGPSAHCGHHTTRHTGAMSVMDKLISWLVGRAGIAHRDAAHRAGHSDHAIKRAVAAGLIRRVRGAWLALPSAPTELVRAASVSGRLTCVTATDRLGLWTPTAVGDLGHIAVAPGASRFDTARLRLHWSRGPVIASRERLVDPIENVLFHVANCRPPAEALAVWESAVRTGQSLDYLRHIRWGSAAAERVLHAVTLLSDSGLETQFFARLAPLGLRVRRQIVVDGHPVDGVIGERLLTQLDGFEFHSDAASRRRDLQQDVRLQLRGYTVLRFDYAQVMFDWPYVEASVLGAIAQGLHLGRRTA